MESNPRLNCDANNALLTRSYLPSSVVRTEMYMQVRFLLEDLWLMNCSQLEFRYVYVRFPLNN